MERGIGARNLEFSQPLCPANARESVTEYKCCRLPKMSKSWSYVRSVVELALLIMAAASGITVATLVWVTMKDFKGECLLYGVPHFFSSKPRFVIFFSSRSNCQFIVAVQIVVSCLTLPAMVLTARYLMNKTRHTSNFVPLAYTAFYALCWTLVLMAACILTVGLNTVCKRLDDKAPPNSGWPKTCPDYQRITWLDDLNGSRFYSLLETAIGASWISFGAWLLLPVVAWCGVRFVPNQRLVNSNDRISDVET
ncbi:transmembrane protein 179B-like, partial [Diadema antillarum]|uniref:transmembrane protein 179B-like n=1 Tax=Diadema antillarum TaxID=105358 RepID=UPI003A8A2458